MRGFEGVGVFLGLSPKIVDFTTSFQLVIDFFQKLPPLPYQLMW
jgi:hypothetical protein